MFRDSFPSDSDDQNKGTSDTTRADAVTSTMGILRGFYRKEDKPFIEDSDDTDIYPIVKFAIDATQRRCIVALGSSRPRRGTISKIRIGRKISFDEKAVLS